MIKLAKENNIDSMVELFIGYINNSFLAGLGKTFLRIFLKALVQSTCALNFVYVIDSKIIGFICSTYDCSGLFKEIFIKKGIAFLTAVLRSILKKPAILKELWASFLYVRRTMRDSVKAELLFIAIKPDYRLYGIATLLINYSLMELEKRGIQKVRVSTDQSNIPVNRLLQKLAFEPISAFQLFGKRMCLYNRQI